MQLCVLTRGPARSQVPTDGKGIGAIQQTASRRCRAQSARTTTRLPRCAATYPADRAETTISQAWCSLPCVLTKKHVRMVSIRPLPK